MSAPASAEPHAPHAQHHPINYVRVWQILCVLLAISVVGPMVGIRWLTLLTAFGIAGVKAYLVATRFMHLNLEKKFVTYIVVTMLILMALFFGGVSPDVMRHEGQRWENTAAKAEVARGLTAAPAAHH